MRLALLMIATWVIAIFLGGAWAALTVDGAQVPTQDPEAQVEI